MGAEITPVERFGGVVYGTWRGGAEVAKDTRRGGYKGVPSSWEWVPWSLDGRVVWASLYRRCGMGTSFYVSTRMPQRASPCGEKNPVG